MSSDSHGELGHILPKKTYYSAFAALLVLTFLTVAASGVHFGSPIWNLVVAMLIASVKAAVVMLFFMHARYENPVLWIYIAIPLITLALLFFGIFIDNPYRIVVEPYEATAKELAPQDVPAPLHTDHEGNAPNAEHH